MSEEKKDGPTFPPPLAFTGDRCVCNSKEPHFVPPMFGDEGFYVCRSADVIARFEDLQAKLAKAEEERDHLRIQIRGHCALILGHCDHTDNPVDCLGEVHHAAVDRDRRLSSAVKVVEAAEDEMKHSDKVGRWTSPALRQALTEYREQTGSS